MTRVTLSVLCVCAMSATAMAQTVSMQTTRSAIGFFGGASIDPEQGFVGVFWQTPEIGNRFHLRPGIDGSFGGNAKRATISIDFIARFRLGASGWHFIQGGGPAIVIAKVEAPSGASDTDISAGGSYVLGFAHDSGLLGEFRIGGGGSVPMLKLVAGYSIGF